MIGYILKRGLPYVNKEFLTTEPSLLDENYGIAPMIINTIYSIMYLTIVILQKEAGAGSLME